MNLYGFSESVTMAAVSSGCARCGSIARLAHGTCVGCFLQPAVEGEGSNGETFAAVLRSIEIHDADWHIGNYQMLEEIGRGGMGVIYRARQRHSRRIVALKRILSYHADAQETLARFRREAEAAASLDHPNILPIYEVSEAEDGLPFFTMKYAAGGTLLDAKAALRNEPRRAVELMAKLARAVQHAHGQDILHRDLKPGNILLDARGEPLVSDFGLAKWLDTSSDLTRTLAVYGTPGYIAPEQINGARCSLTPTVDVYSLGAILFDLLTRRPPFLGETALAVLQQASEKPAPRLRSLVPTLDRDLETICAKCLEREPLARYQSAGELADDLERWLEGRPIISRPASPPARIWRWSKREPQLATALIAALGFAVAAAFLFFSHSSATPPPPVDKSIAVLPFENLSGNENAYFTRGIQYEILADLARIAELKVISRTSSGQFPPEVQGDARTIGKALGVTHLLEGSVQRVGEKVRVSAELINVRTSQHLWGERYERPVTDVFIVQSEIAKKVAGQLRARLLPSVKAAIERSLTEDIEAFDLYTEGRDLVQKLTLSSSAKNNLLQGVELLNQAVARDPDFFDAYCQLGLGHGMLYFLGYDHTETRRNLADSAVRKAISLRSDAGEAHLAQADYLYHCQLDYDRALTELEIAARSLPNEPWIFIYAAAIARRQGHWEQCVQNFDKALDLDPRNVFCMQQVALAHQFLRQFPEMARALDRALVIAPKDVDLRAWRALVELDWKADPKPLHDTIQKIVSESPVAAESVTDVHLFLTFCERDPAELRRALAAYPAAAIGWDAMKFPRAWYEGVGARILGDQKAADAAFSVARMKLEHSVQEQRDHGPVHSMLGMVYAGLGLKNDAVREGERAVELLPVSKDSINGGHAIKQLAIVYAWTGDKDRAITRLSEAVRIPGRLTYGELKLHPYWDPLRGDPRFEKIVVSLAPKK